MPYATEAQFRSYMPQVPDNAATDTRIATVLANASSILDLELGHGWAAGAIGTQTAYGDGTDYLAVPPFVAGSVTLVETISGYTVPDYIEQDGMLVVVRDDLLRPIYSTSTLAGLGYAPLGGWVAGVPYTVSATFGYGAAPDWAVEATLQIAIRLFNGAQAGFSDVVGVDGGGAVGYNGAFSNLVKEVIDRYKATTRGAGIY